MVFGFGGPGKIELILEKVNYSPGETIKGTAILEMKKPKEAKQVKVVFEGAQTRYSSGVSVIGSSSRSKSERRVFHSFEVMLDGEKEYQPGRYEYPFEIAIPANLVPPQPGGTVGTALSAVQMLGGMQTRVEWTVKAALDIPHGMDISKTVQINVG